MLGNKPMTNFILLDNKMGKKRNNQSEKVSQAVKDQLDPDIAEYMAPNAKRAYQMGYEDTYVPTFWEKYGWYIRGSEPLSFYFGIFSGTKI